MVIGRVDDRGSILRAVTEVLVSGESSLQARVQAVVDTGFSEFLTLPSHAIRALGLVPEYEENLVMANGQTVKMVAYAASIDWDGQAREVKVLESEGDPLIGMAMLRNHDLQIRVIPNGPVAIDAIE